MFVILLATETIFVLSRFLTNKMTLGITQLSVSVASDITCMTFQNVHVYMC